MPKPDRNDWMHKLGDAKMTLGGASLCLTIENKVREAEAAHDQVVEAVRQQEKWVTAQNLWSM